MIVTLGCHQNVIKMLLKGRCLGLGDFAMVEQDAGRRE